MFSLKLSISLLLAATCSIASIESAIAKERSSLKMSFSNSKISVSPEQKTSKLHPKSKHVTRSVNRKDSQTGWYWGTVRGANFPNMAATDGNNITRNWGGNNALGSLIDLSNLNAFAGYKSSNFRLEGEVAYATNSMTRNANQIANGNDGAPINCDATTFAAIVNAYYDIETGGQIKPFVGAGVGFASTNLKGEGKDWGSASGLTYQLKAGVGYTLSDRQDIYLQYKYVNAPAQYVINNQANSTDFSYGSVEFGTKFNF
jgi:opacity protein-like surface antigen